MDKKEKDMKWPASVLQLHLQNTRPSKPPARQETEVLGSGPLKVVTNHLIELFIEGNKKLT